MPAESVLVDDVRDIARERTKGRRQAAAAGSVRVRFASGAAGRLDLAKPRDRVWAEVLESLRTSSKPAYVAIDADSGFITSLLLPRQFLVAALRPLEGGDVEVELEISHARHYLRRTQSDFERMRATLEQSRRDKSPVLVTESLDSSAIIDVRPAPAPAARTRRRR